MKEGAAKGFAGHSLSELFSSVVEQFSLVAQGCHLVGRTMVKVASRNNEWCQAKLEQGEVWAKVQTTVSATWGLFLRKRREELDYMKCQSLFSKCNWRCI